MTGQVHCLMSDGPQSLRQATDAHSELQHLEAKSPQAWCFSGHIKGIRSFSTDKIPPVCLLWAFQKSLLLADSSRQRLHWGSHIHEEYGAEGDQSQGG